MLIVDHEIGAVVGIGLRCWASQVQRQPTRAIYRVMQSLAEMPVRCVQEAHGSSSVCDASISGLVRDK